MNWGQSELARPLTGFSFEPMHTIIGNFRFAPPKAALESLVRYFAVALAKRGITVNAF